MHSYTLKGSNIRSESWQSEDNQNLKSGRPRHYFGCPHFVTFTYVHGISSHTAVFIGKEKITLKIYWNEIFRVNYFTKIW